MIEQVYSLKTIYKCKKYELLKHLICFISKTIAQAENKATGTTVCNCARYHEQISASIRERTDKMYKY